MNEIPEYYRPGSRLHISLASQSGGINATVVHPITPFTTSQVLVCRIEHNPTITSPSSLAVVKVYDPRFFKDRYPTDLSLQHPWSHEAEAAAASSRQNQYPVVTSREYPVSPDWGDPGNNSPAAWEEFYFQHAEYAFQAEVKAYDMLSDWQGRSILYYLGAGTLPVSTLSSPRAIIPRVLLLEYLPDAVTLNDIDPQRITRPVLRSLFETAEAFASLGIIHTDLHGGNILLTPAEHPVRGCIIDFGCSFVRQEESDEEWEFLVAQNSDVRAVQVSLKRVEYRDFSWVLEDEHRGHPRVRHETK
ncbi:hypothetical protein JAAARDRAFT_206613 [Jaapia argillacea MUCL 33604]|uniref:Aminoglycoside phosphotransferase domain-containing protein n=1 Tax=Jaapia argillacea MUCL 33604 TaxID=933084 RepID=A0A067PVB1_9AGAM|nr:hypothetical protein JAAARDRAFT_206613 [Jaapia argillacea MUCL 33604]